MNHKTLVDGLEVYARSRSHLSELQRYRLINEVSARVLGLYRSGSLIKGSNYKRGDLYSNFELDKVQLRTQIETALKTAGLTPNNEAIDAVIKIVEKAVKDEATTSEPPKTEAAPSRPTVTAKR